MRFKLHALIWFSALAVLALAVTGCRRSAGRLDDPTPHAMGQEVRVGQLSYVVMETRWLTEMSDELDSILPKNRFLTITVSITNHGPAQQTVPLLTLIDSAGKEYLELSQARGLVQWLGALRMLQPQETQSGKIVFDVPNGNYSLRITDGGDPESEHTALIHIPMTVNSPVDVTRPDLP